MRFPTHPIAAIFLTLAACSLAVADEPGDAAGGNAAETEKQPLIAVGPDTTILTEPLDDEGYVDFQAHANAVMSKGVTPENNAAVLLWRVYGPANIDEEHRAEYFKRLGMEPLPKVGEYYREYEEFAEDGKLEEIQDHLDAALSRPWRKEEFPPLARWLKANEKQLALAVQASERPKLYQPLLGAPLMMVLLPHLQESRGVVRALTARAMLHAGEGDTAAAQKDLLVVHRLAQLHDQGSTIIDSLVALALDSIALHAEASLAHSGKLTARQARDFAAKIAALAPMTPMKDRIDKMERYFYIDGVTSIARNPKQADELAIPAAYVKLLAQAIDWNESLRYGNGWYDRMVAALDKPTYLLQKTDLDAINEELAEVAKNATSGKRIAALLLTFGEKRKKLLGQAMGEILVLQLIPAVSAAKDAERRNMAERRLVAAAFALAAYKKDHGKYPDELAKLTPDYMKEVPQDVFSGAPARYASDGDDYLLYSVGPNLKDDGGFGRQDDVDFDADDVAVRTGKKAIAGREG